MSRPPDGAPGPNRRGAGAQGPLWTRALLWGVGFSLALLAFSFGRPAGAERDSLLDTVQSPGTLVAHLAVRADPVVGTRSAAGEMAAVVVTGLVNAALYSAVAAAILAWHRRRDEA